MVLPHLLGGLRRLQRFFIELEFIAGLGVNVAQAVVIPLGDASHFSVRRSIADSCPGWAGLPIRGAGTYLGFVLGPDRGTSSWTGPFAKVTERAALWSSAPLGLQLTAAAYSTYILSTCLFVAQLDPVPEGWEAIERRALRRLVPGPGNWCSARDLNLLRDGYGLPKAFPPLRQTALACKMRVYHFEAQADGGLRVFPRLTALRATVSANPWLGREARWDSWLGGSFLQHLQSARDDCAAHGITHSGVFETVATDLPRPWTLAV